jgi:hypothetical protein
MQSYIPQLQPQRQGQPRYQGCGLTEQHLTELCQATHLQHKSERDFELVESISHPLLDEIRSYGRIIPGILIDSIISTTRKEEEARWHNASMPIGRQSIEVAGQDDVSKTTTTKHKSLCNATLPQRRDSFQTSDETDRDTNQQQQEQLTVSSPLATSPKKPGPVAYSPRTRLAHANLFFRTRILCNALNDMGLFDGDSDDDEGDEGKDEQQNGATNNGFFKSRTRNLIDHSDCSDSHTTTRKKTQPFSRFPPSA